MDKTAKYSEDREEMDKECVEGIQLGIESSFKLLFDNYYLSLTLYANKFLCDTEASKDVVQSLFVDIWERRRELDSDKSIKSFLFISVKHRSLNILKNSRVAKRESLLPKHDEINMYTPEFIVEDDTLELIDNAISKLPPKCKEIFLLSKRSNVKSKDIAQQFGISKRTVDFQLGKALKILRVELKNVGIYTLALLSTILKIQ